MVAETLNQVLEILRRRETQPLPAFEADDLAQTVNGILGYLRTLTGEIVPEDVSEEEEPTDRGALLDVIQTGDGLVSFRTPDALVIALDSEPSRARVITDAMHYGVKRGKVIGAYNSAGNAYTNYATDGFIHFVLVAPQLPGSTDFSEVVEDRLYIKATEIRGDIDMSPVGYTDVVANDEIGYVLGGLLEQVPGLAPYFPFHGQLYHQAGGQGAQLASAYEVITGPGIKITAIGVSQDKTEVELAAVPGLEFDAGGDAGKLRVKANAAKAVIVEAAGVGVVANAAKSISVSAGGVAVDIAAENPGLTRDGAGDLKVLPDGTKGIAVGAQGVRVKINDGVDGLRFDANVLKTKPDTARGIGVDGDGIFAKVESSGPLFISGATGDLDLGIANNGGLIIDGPPPGNLKVNVDTTKGITLADDGKVKVILDTTNLEFDSGAVKHKQDGPLQAGHPVEKIQFRVDGGVLQSRIYVPGLEGWMDWVPGAQLDFDGAAHVVGVAPD